MRPSWEDLHLCGEQNNSGKCDALLPGGTYAANMGYETKERPFPLLDDINICNLAAVSWAIPDKYWSDHAGENNGSRPYYVANIVDAIGNSGCYDVVGNTHVPYWKTRVHGQRWGAALGRRDLRQERQSIRNDRAGRPRSQRRRGVRDHAVAVDEIHSELRLASDSVTSTSPTASTPVHSPPFRNGIMSKALNHPEEVNLWNRAQAAIGVA